MANDIRGARIDAASAKFRDKNSALDSFSQKQHENSLIDCRKGVGHDGRSSHQLHRDAPVQGGIMARHNVRKSVPHRADVHVLVVVLVARVQ